jgi:hypothetical protein
MKIYVWQQYGHIHVYAAETVDDLQRLQLTMLGIVEIMAGCIDEITMSKGRFENAKLLNRRDLMMREITYLASFGKDYELFEYNSFTSIEE